LRFLSSAELEVILQLGFALLANVRKGEFALLRRELAHRVAEFLELFLALIRGQAFAGLGKQLVAQLFDAGDLRVAAEKGEAEPEESDHGDGEAGPKTPAAVEGHCRRGW